VGNIGAPPVAPGGALRDPANRVVIVSGTGGTAGSGASGDIWHGTSEGFTYVFRPWTGDGILTARLLSFTASDGGAKAGVMLRETNSAGARNAITYMIAGGSAFFQTKSATNGNVTNSSTTGLGVPRWLRLVRSGNTFTGFHSHDGVEWIPQGAPATIAMAGPDLTAGLAVAPRTGGQTANAVFDHVTFTASRPTAYEQWRFDQFDAFDNSGAAADGADPDADGVANLAEFVLHGDPRAADPSILPKPALTATTVEFSFRRRADSIADTLQYFESSATLADWTSLRISPPTDPCVFVSPVGNGLETITISLPANSGPRARLFGRLRVSLP
jgi:hypothetical protein